jgi:hypothetical protein
MSAQMEVEALIEAAKHLTPAEQDRLVQALLRQSKSKLPQHHITEMRGLGKELLARD